jgi:hypothetical protein
MTQPTTPGAAPAGWYPITPGSSQLRWWDGTQWTEHEHMLSLSSGQPLSAPAGTNPNTVWVWIFALFPLAQLAEIPLISALYSRIFAVGLSDPTATSTAEFAPDSGYFAIQGISLFLFAVYVVLAVLDYRSLRARGVPSPFHWAWTFLGSLVYIIGRTVVVRRRTGAGMAPMWIGIITIVGVAVVIIVVLVPIVTAGVGSLSSLPG